MMKVLDRFIVFSILKIAVITILIFALLLAAVELFAKMDQIMTGHIPTSRLIEYILLSIPQYLMMVSALSLLFATTYFLSQLSATNELIALLNGGISKFRISLPIITVAIILTLGGFVYQELLLNKIEAKHDQMEAELFGRSSTQDARNIVLQDGNGYIIYTNHFDELTNTISYPVLVYTTDGKIMLRLEAHHGQYDEGEWKFYNAKVYDLADKNNIRAEWMNEYSPENFNLEPHLFRTQNTNIETMDGKSAREFLTRLKTVDKAQWQEKATDYYRALTQPLAILVLMIISVTMNYRFKKNVLLFCIIQSLSIAVVYYVADMVFSIAAHQGAVSPYQCVYIPIIVTLLLAWCISFLTRRIT